MQENFAMIVGSSSYAKCLDEDGTLNFDVNVSIKHFENSEKKTANDQNVIREQVLNNFSGLFDNPSYSDFTIKLKGKEFKTHRAILAASSPVFRKMFETEMQESISNECKVNEIEPDIFEHMLRFIYCGKMPENLSEIAFLLYDAAHYYEVLSLKQICLTDIQSRLSADIALEIYYWAYDYDMEELKADAWKIVKR